MTDQKLDIFNSNKSAEDEEKMQPYVISQEEYKTKIQPSWEKKTPLIMEGAARMGELTPDTEYSVGLRIEENAANYPNKLALLYEDERYTHKEFNSSINRYANYFLKCRFKRGDTAVVFVENRSEYMFVILALGKIGVLSSLINTNLRENPLIHSMTHTPGKLYIVGEELYQAFEDVKSRLGLTNDQNQNIFYLLDKGEQDTPKGYINLKKEIKDSSINNPSTTSDILMKD
ncbi:MAG: AMP-binding protein, partial [Promethearchaeota archaeon]